MREAWRENKRRAGKDGGQGRVRKKSEGMGGEGKRRKISAERKERMDKKHRKVKRRGI